MLLGLVLIAIAAASWGTTGATMTLLSREAAASPLLVGWSRLAIAAPVLVLAAAGAARFGARPPARRRWPSLADLPLCAALGLAMAAYQVCYFRAVTLVGVAPAALLAICSAPLLIAVLAALFLGERLTRLVRLSLGMAVAGTALLVVGPRGFSEIAGHFGLGALLALGAGVSYAVYAVAAKGLLARVTPLAVSAITFALAALFLAPALLGETAPTRALAAGWPLLLYLGLGPTAVAYVLFTAGLGRVPATAAGIVSLLEPLTATTLGLLVFGERLGPVGITGALLLLAALALLTTARRPAGVRS
ncbi:MAG TPA: EamA family transporter [Candidatus Acidoferrum sp.]|jgi:DME family drug/metabolite transporter|nr:EamA family transporter [Candidatus Acidoferrum sp.]